MICICAHFKLSCPSTKVSLAVLVPASKFGWLLTLMTPMRTPVPAAPSGSPALSHPHGSFVLAPCTFNPPHPPPISWSRDSPVSHLDRSHYHSLASRRWLGDGASRCIVGNHFDRGRGYQQRVGIFHICQYRVSSRASTEINPKRVKGNYRVNWSRKYHGSLCAMTDDKTTTLEFVGNVGYYHECNKKRSPAFTVNRYLLCIFSSQKLLFCYHLPTLRLFQACMNFTQRKIFGRMKMKIITFIIFLCVQPFF